MMSTARGTALASLLVVIAPFLSPTPVFSQGTSARLPPALHAAQPGGAVRAVVIGIDHYKNGDLAPPLSGAVADADDIAQSLRASGVEDLTVLTEAAATRAAVVRAVSEMTRRASPKDLVILTFAGHGTRQRERVAGSEPDGLDELFVLWGFDFIGAGADEYILDDEMHNWLDQLSRRAGHVVFLADSCFGGGMTKQVDPRITPLPVRALPSRPVALAPAAPSRPPQGQIPRRDNATQEWRNVSFISAVDDATQDVEVWIAGEPTPRGAASYAFARAIGGLADAEGDRDGVTTRRELFAYIRRHIRRLSSDRQYPITEPRRLATAEFGVFRTPPAASRPQRRPTAVDAASSSEPAWAEAAFAARGAKLVQDPATGDIIDPAGAVVAYSKTPAALAAAQGRHDAYLGLLDLADGRGLDLDIEPAGRDLKLADRFTLAAREGLYGRYLLMLNLAGDGTVQFLFPKGRVDPYWDRDALTQEMEASEPAGADTLILVATTERRIGLEVDLGTLDQKVRPGELVAALAKHLGPDDRLGLATYTTRR